MRKSEAVQLRLVSSCRDLRSEMKHEDFESTLSFLAGKVSNSSFQEACQNDIESKGTSANELEDGELNEGIEANDVSALLERFLEYEEKQGSVDGSMAPLSSLKDTSYEGQTVSDKINSFVETHEPKFDFPCDVEIGGLPSISVENSEQFHSAENTENQEVHETMSCGSSQDNAKGQDEKSNIVKNFYVDNHATDHNYACCGFPMRKPIQLRPEDYNTLKNSALKCSPQESLDMEKKNHLISEETRSPYSHKRRSSCNENSPDRKRKLPKRYRGPYCEESSGGESSCDEECHYRQMSTDNDRDRTRENSIRKFSYSSDGDRSYHKRSNRRHSMCSNDSYDGREFSSSDEESKNGKRYDPRHSECDWQRRQSSGSDRESDHYKSPHYRRRSRGRRRSCRRDSTEKRNGVTENKIFHDIEFERKLEFKFDHNIRDTAKEERRIVYIGKISNKTTKDDVFKRFRPFGPIEKVTVHFREKGDNYAFVTFFETSSAAEAIERGNEDSRLPVLDLCFGGRRKFCGGSYVDFDSNTSYLEEQELSRPPSSDEMGFDALLRMSQKNLKSRKESCKGRYMY